MSWLLLLVLAADGGVSGAASVPPPQLRSTAPWSPVDDADGVRLERRAVPGSSYFEYRATLTTAEVAPEAFCTSVYDWGSYAPHDEVKARRLLGERPGERVVYDQVEQAVVSNRDYALVQRRRDEGGSCHIVFWADNALAPPLPRGTVRMDRVWGTWDFEPAGGGTKVTYVMFSDPAGSIPAFLVRGAQQQSVVDTMHGALRRAKSGVLPRHP